MEIKLKLEHEQVEQVIVKYLKDQYEWLRKSPPLGFDGETELVEAYKLVLQDNMGYQDFQKYIHDLAKKKKGNSKRLVDAHNGL